MAHNPNVPLLERPPMISSLTEQAITRRWEWWEDKVRKRVWGEAGSHEAKDLPIYKTIHYNRMRLLRNMDIPTTTIVRQDLDDPTLLMNDFLLKVDIIEKRRLAYKDQKQRRKKMIRDKEIEREKDNARTS